MNIDQLRKLCLSFPGATEQIQWGDDLLFKVGGKMFAVTSLEPAKVWISLKSSPENFAELTERPGVIPAPYLARAKWVALEAGDAIVREKLAELLHGSYELVLARLPKKLPQPQASKASKTGNKRVPKKRKRVEKAKKRK